MRVRDNGLAGNRVSSIGLGDRAVRMRYGALDGTLVSLLELGGHDGWGRLGIGVGWSVGRDMGFVTQIGET